RLRRERREERPALETGSVLVAEDRDEVVEHPRAVEAERFGFLPRGEGVVPARPLIRRLDAEANPRRRRVRGDERRGGELESDEEAHGARLTHAPSREQGRSDDGGRPASHGSPAVSGPLPRGGVVAPRGPRRGPRARSARAGGGARRRLDAERDRHLVALVHAL